VGEEAEFSASGRVIAFPGFLRAYVEGEDDPDAELADREVVLPALAVGDVVEGSAFAPGSHTTQPPARYTEASLVKAMEELGVGRPSTYASVIATILERGYVWKKGTALVPSFTAFAVVGLLERYFGDLVDYGFTASMEDDLDEIASGREESLPWLSRFYFGTSSPGVAESALGEAKAGSQGNGATSDGAGSGKALGLKASVAAHLGDIDAREINSIAIGNGSDGVPIVARVGRYGPYLQRGDDRASLPGDMCPDELTVARSEELLAAPTNDRVLGTDPDSGLDISVKAGRFGPYVQLGEGGEDAGKPRTSSLFSTMDPATLTLAQAIELLSIPRRVGADPESGEEVVAHNGKFGPYLKKGTDTRSLASEDQILTVTLPEAQALFAQPKQRRGRTAAAPLRELGADPATQLPVVLKEGRFGPYVTDGTTNASLRKGDVVESITMERASELLAERRAAGPSTRKKAGIKKAGAKKSGAKKATGVKKAAGTKNVTGAKKATKKATGVRKAAGTKKAAAATTAASERVAPLEPF
jgi:DNA topoisomerase I